MTAQQHGVITYGGQTWSVASEPVVIDRNEDEVLVEVWIRKGEDIDEPQ